VAIYSYSVRGIVSRGAGKSSLSASAYLCRAQFRDERTGKIFDWRQSGSAIGDASAYLDRSDVACKDRQCSRMFSCPGFVPDYTGQQGAEPRCKDVGLPCG